MDSHVQGDGLAESRRPLAAQRGDTLEHLERGFACPRRIVLVSDGRAEDREHGVADEFLHEAVIARDRLGERLEQDVLERAHPLGIEPLGERGEPGEIGEEHRHLAPIGLGRRLTGAARRATARTEREVRLEREAAPGAGQRGSLRFGHGVKRRRISASSGFSFSSSVTMRGSNAIPQIGQLPA